MKTRRHLLSFALFSWAMVVCLLQSAQQIVVAQDSAGYNQQELDQMLAPIALYPDGLLSQILMAATYPDEVLEAARWSLANPNLRAGQAVEAVTGTNWDPSVQSLVAFPQVLRMLSSKRNWMERLGDAFLGQEAAVMQTVQALRQRAYLAGNLVSNTQARIVSSGDVIVIEQADPQVAYAPYYNPTVVYGTWWWPQSPPVYWSAWPGYRDQPGYGNGFMWGVGIVLGAGYFYGAFDWRQHEIHVVNRNNRYFRQDNRFAPGAQRVWQHETTHRRGTPYRMPTVAARFNTPGVVRPPRNALRGHLPDAPPNQPAVNHPPGSGTKPHPPPGAKPPEARPRDRVPHTPIKPQEVPVAKPPEGRPHNQVPHRPTTSTIPIAPTVTTTLPRMVTTPPPVKPAHENRGDATHPPEKAQQATAAMPHQAAVPHTPVPRASAPRESVRAPHVLENLGQAEAARAASERGRVSRQAPAKSAPPRPPTQSAAPAPAVRPPPGGPPSQPQHPQGKDRPGGGHK